MGRVFVEAMEPKRNIYEDEICCGNFSKCILVVIAVVFLMMIFLSPINAQEQSNPNEELINAVCSGSIEKINALLKSGIDVNAGIESGYTALMQALYMSDREIVKFLLDKDADPNVGRGEYPALIFPCMLAQYDIVKMLLDAGADPNIKDEKGNKPLKYVRDYYAQGVEYLVDNQNNAKEALNGNLKKVSEKVAAWNAIARLLVSVGATE